MKLKDIKHNHSLTDLLKVLIFSILMITPLLSVATRCLYVICNKNAYQSAEITQTTYNKAPKYELGDINNGLEESKIYHFECNNLPLNHLYLSNNLLFEFNILNGSINFNTLTSISLDDYTSEESENTVIYSLVDNDITIVSIQNEFYTSIFIEQPNLTINADILILTTDSGLDISFFSNTTYQEYDYVEVQSTTLDNVFEYSLSKLESDQYISWTKNTAIYTGVSAMTTQLQFEGNVIPMLITYWLLLMIIYIILDIVIVLFTKITHMLGNKQT